MKPIIQVRGLSKQYRIGVERPRYGSLRESLVNASKAPFRAFKGRANDAHPTIWALRDVSFDVMPGEVVGVIGRNGAGKSTLLKVLTRITEPTRGEVDLYGRVASLLEVGTGFHPELTGRENIYLNGAILGMRKAEIDRKFDEIVAFAEIEKFLDTAVKHYSTGMYVRLAFAVAAHLEPEVLLVDEVLAVGDAEFQKKCMGKMGSVAASGKTVLFVSHNMAAIAALCSHGVVLDSGRVVQSGLAADCVGAYQAGRAGRVSTQWKRVGSVQQTPLTIEEVTVTLLGHQPSHALTVKATMRSTRSHQPAFVAVDLTDPLGTSIMQALPTIGGFIRDHPSDHVVEVTIDLPPLIPGEYFVTVWVGSHNSVTFDQAKQCVSFEVLASPTAGRTVPHTPDHGFIVPHSTVRQAPD